MGLIFQEETIYTKSLEAGVLVIIIRVEHRRSEGALMGRGSKDKGLLHKEGTVKAERDRQPRSLKPEELWCRVQIWDGTNFQTPGDLPLLSSFSSSHFLQGRKKRKKNERGEKRLW